MSYERFVTTYHRYTTTARSTDEAFKTATYACAIEKPVPRKSVFWSFVVGTAITTGLMYILLDSLMRTLAR